MSKEGQKPSNTSITDQPQGTIQITISAGDGVQGQMAGQLIFDQDSSFITDLLEMADRTVHGPIPIGQSEEIIEPPKPSPRRQQQTIAASRFRQPSKGESLYAGHDQCHYGQPSRAGGGCDNYSCSCNDPSTSDMYEDLETGPESCVVTPRQTSMRTIDGKERMTAGCDQKCSEFCQPESPLCQPLTHTTNGRERMAAGGEIRRCGDLAHNMTSYYQHGPCYPTLSYQSYSYPNTIRNQRQSDGRLTSGYCYCNPGYPSPCGFGDCSKAPFGFGRAEPCPQPLSPAASGAASGGGFDMGAHNQNMQAQVYNTQSNLKGLRCNLSCTTEENVDYVWDSNYSYYSSPWGSTDKNYFNAGDRVYFQQKVDPGPCEDKVEDSPCPIHPTTCPDPAPCPPPDCSIKCPTDLCGKIVTTEAFTRAKQAQWFDTNMTGCAERRTTEQDNFRRSVIPKTRDLPDAPSFKENQKLQFACGQDQMEGEEMYSNNKQDHYFARSTTYGNCFEKRSTEDRDLKRRLGCPMSLPKPTYGQFRCDLYPMSGGNQAAGPHENANKWDTSFPKEEIFLHHLQEWETEQNDVGFSEVKNDQKEFKRTSRPDKTVLLDPEEFCKPIFIKTPCEHRSCAGGDGEPKCMRETADAGCVEPEAEDNDEENEEEDEYPPGDENKFSPCSGQGNAVITKNFRTRRVDRDCSGTIELLQTELDQENSHTTCWGASVYAQTGVQPKRSNAFDRMCCA